MPPVSSPPDHPTRRAILGRMLAAGAAAPFLARAVRAAEPIDVAGPEALAQALTSAPPGTLVRLAPGDYGALVMTGGGGRADAPLTLAAADPGHPPRFSRMDLRNVTHLVLDGLAFDYRFTPGDALYLRPFTIADATGVTLRGAVFTGDRAQGVSVVDDGFGTGFGLVLTQSRDMVVEGCTISDFYRGLSVARCRDLAVRGNDLHTIRMDGMNFAQVQDLVIEGNHIHDFNRSLDSPDHADMIQFWTNKTTAPSTDVVIRGNLLSSGKGWFTQSIFMRNEEVDQGRAGPEMFYRRITIEENAIFNAHLHGITMGETDGLLIRRNTVVRNARSEGTRPNVALWTPTIRVAETSRDVTIEANVVAKIAGFDSQPDWHVGQNFLVQDRTQLEPGYYATVFTGDAADPAGFAYRAGGPLDRAGIGAPQLQRG